MSQVRLNFLDWRPDAEALGSDGLTKAKNVLHDTEGYKPLTRHTTFSVSEFYSGATLHSVRSLQIRQVGMNANRVAAMAQDRATTSAISDLTIGLEGEASPFTTISSGTLASAGGVRVASFSVAEMESGVFGVCATYDASLASGGSTILSITGEVTYTITSESEGTSGSGTTSLEGGGANHARTASNSDVYAGVYLKNDGVEFAVGDDGTYEGSTLTSWLDTGSADSIWANCSVDSGSLNIDAGTDEWLVLSDSRAWAIRQSSVGTGTGLITLSMATDSAGENVIDSASYTLSAIREGVILVGTTSSHSNFRVSAICHAGVSINTSGVEYAYSNGGSATGTNLGNWLIGGSAGDNYIRCTVLSGTINGDDSGADTWLQLNSTRSWSITQAENGTNTASIRLEVDTVGDGSNIIASNQYDISAMYNDLS